MKVADLISKLSAMPAEADVRVVDADTGWLLPIELIDWEKHSGDIFMAGAKENTVLVAGSYSAYFAEEEDEG